MLVTDICKELRCKLNSLDDIKKTNMGTVILIVIGVVVGFAILGFLFSPSGEKEDGAKTGAAVGCSFISSIAPTVFIIVIVVLLVRACS